MSTVEYSHSELRGLFVVPGAALFVISCLSSVDSSLNLFCCCCLFVCLFVFLLLLFFSRAFLSKNLNLCQATFAPLNSI